jgi:hypothetical protein
LAEGLSKVSDRGRPKILKAQQRFVRCKPNAINRRFVGQFRRRIDQMSFAHFPFALVHLQLFQPDFSQNYLQLSGT